MSFETKNEFTKDNIDIYLKAIAKEYRKRIGKNMPAEIILIGGASVLINYGFRDASDLPTKNSGDLLTEFLPTHIMKLRQLAEQYSANSPNNIPPINRT